MIIELLNQTDSAKFLNVTRQTIKNWIKKGYLNVYTYKGRRTPLIATCELDFQANRRNPSNMMDYIDKDLTNIKDGI